MIVEKLNHNNVHTKRLQQLHLVFVRQDQFRCTLGSENLQRMGFKSKNDGWKSQAASFGYRVADQHLVTDVNTIEIPHGYHGPRNSKAPVVYVTYNLHCSYPDVE